MTGNRETRFVSRLTRETLALVMAGGRGTRLMQLTSARAKPAVPFGGKFRIIDFTLSNCINSGIRRIGVLTQYKSNSLLRPLQLGWSFLRGQLGEFVELLPAEQRGEIASWYAGTADAVYQNLDFIKEHQPAYVLILAGDHVYKMDYGRMLAHHARTGAMITVGCLEVPLQEASAFGVMQIDENTRVRRFDEKPRDPQPIPGKPDRALASMGIYVFDAHFLLRWLLRDAGIAESSHDFGKDVVPSAIAEGGVYAYEFTDLYDPARQGYWRDVGTVDAYWQANLELTDVTPELNLYDEEWPIWTHTPQVPPAKFVFDDPERRGCATDSLISGGCIVSGAQVRRSVLFSRVRVDSGSRIEETLLLPDVRVGRNCRVRKAIIDEGCELPDGTVIGEDRERDARLFHVSEGGVTLVTREMLLA
ncbi:glucose-1-phosphate adenylyltransferase [Solimonas variicoloris]|uniref:glucose-1-phosphate adenylyltransferase n=1 Tax=Solimonas variicoloris TaxID=254408 RepID=UPI00035EB388|nr:glucose-1-phosphate adenylyltransferase [Solimonas variicoloris]